MKQSLSSGDIDGLIFDMDGLLFDTENEWLECYIEAAREHGINEDIRETCLGVIGRTETDTKRIYREKFGKEFPLEEIEIATVKRREARREKMGIPVKTGAREIIEMLQTKNIPYTIASSSHHDHIWRNLELADMSALFTTVIGGNQVTRGKPDPEIFQKATELLGLQPARCIVLEDSVNGLRAAYDAGTTPILVLDLVEHPEESMQRAHRVYGSLLEVRDYLIDIF